MGARRRFLAIVPIGSAAFFLAITYLPYAAPRRAFDLPAMMVYWTFWCSTAIILCDAACKYLGGPSLLTIITSSRRNFLRFVLTGTVSGLFLDGSAQWLGKLWIYPYWNPAVYWSSFIPGFCAYWLLLAETYLLAKCLLGRCFHGTEHRRPARQYPVAGIMGCGIAVLGLVLALWNYRKAGGYRFELNVLSRAHAPFYTFFMMLAGVWLAIEFLCSTRSRAWLLESFRARDWLPPCSILAAGWLFGFLMETANAAQHFWQYTNWPLERISLCGIPMVVLLAWPLQYVVFLAIYRASFAIARGVQ